MNCIAFLCMFPTSTSGHSARSTPAWCLGSAPHGPALVPFCFRARAAQIIFTHVPVQAAQAGAGRCYTLRLEPSFIVAVVAPHSDVTAASEHFVSNYFSNKLLSHSGRRYKINTCSSPLCGLCQGGSAMRSRVWDPLTALCHAQLWA